MSKKGMWERKRFKVLERQERLALRRMSVKKSIRIMESLLDSGIVEEFKRIQKELDLKR
ncbi:MAG: hypothetical protein NC928_03025 [Candidatus Omnitrophica bacterium]|nr:hypothetical protein [Candidatus Omnitrophota bacterium]